MADSDHYFLSEHNREHAKLSDALRMRRRVLDEAIRQVAATELLSHDPDELLEELWTVGPINPEYGALKPTLLTLEPERFQQYEPHEGELRGNDLEQRYPTMFWRMRWKPNWPADLRGRWPDEVDTDLNVYDPHPQKGAPPCLKWKQLKGFEWLVVDAHVPYSEHDEANPPVELLGEAVDQVERYQTAFNDQLERWIDTTTAEALAALTARQSNVRRGQHRAAEINALFDQWRTPPLNEQPLEQRPVPTRVDRPIPSIVDVLPAATTANIVKVINRWAHAIEKYPDSFLALDEESFSNLLVATLNGAFVRAEREVFIGSGRTDFYVSSHEIPDSGVPSIFSGENKFWSGPSDFLDAVGQAIGNLVEKSPDAVLIVLVKDHTSYSTAIADAMAKLREADARYLGDVAPIATQPTVRLRSPLDTLGETRLTIVFVDLTRTADMLRKPKGRKRQVAVHGDASAGPAVPVEAKPADPST